MKLRSGALWPLVSLLLPPILWAVDDATIYPASTIAAHSSATPSQITTSPPATPVLSAPVPGTTNSTRSFVVPTSVPLPPSSGKTYAVRNGDTLWRIGRSHGTTLEAIKALNGLKSDSLHVGQVLILPMAGYAYRPPQPIHYSSPPQALPTPTPIPEPKTVVASVKSQAPAVPPTASSSSPATTSITTTAPASTPKKLVSPDSVVRVPNQTTLTEAQFRLRAEAENLAKLDLGYDDDWLPPGEQQAWSMDCSNTSRYLYKRAVGIELPRTASDQYYNLKLQNRAWDVPIDANDQPDLAFLHQHLRVGDLLFWENTYKPQRDPPITHVTIFMGTDDKGRWIMMGSQSGGIGKYGSHRGGPDIYLFDPLKPAGGYSTWLGFVHKKGRFVAIGRPLAPLATVASSSTPPKSL